MAKSGAAATPIRAGLRWRPNRGHFALLVLVLVAAWFVVGFARTMTQLNSATERQAAVAAENEALSERVEAGHRELELIQTDGYQALQARGYGLGAPGEVAFSLDAHVDPPAVVPLGARDARARGLAPVDAWLELLFGN
jgi:cell division protein FtsB